MQRTLALAALKANEAHVAREAKVMRLRCGVPPGRCKLFVYVQRASSSRHNVFTTQCREVAWRAAVG